MVSQNSTPRPLRIALLLNDIPMPSVQAVAGGDYHHIYRQLLIDALATHPDESIRKAIEERGGFEVDAYNTVERLEFPSEESLTDRENGYDCLMMTGSAHTAHDPSETWVPPVISFLRSILTSPSKQHIKIIAVCFGMQLLALALGGRCEKSPLGWEIGVYDVELTEVGKEWVGMVPGGGVMQVGEVEKGKDVRIEGGGEDTGKVVDSLEVTEEAKERGIIHLQQFHRDYVPTVPPGCELVGFTTRCPVQAYLQYYPTSPTSEVSASHPKRIRALAMQGHPEFTADIITRMVDAREKSGVLDKETAEEARRRMGMRGGGEGRGVIGWGIWSVIAQQ